MSQPSKHSPSQLFSPPSELHSMDADEDDQNIKQLGKCSSIYIALQDCLINNDRNWKACQKEVQILKECNSRRNN